MALSTRYFKNMLNSWLLVGFSLFIIFSINYSMFGRNNVDMIAERLIKMEKENQNLHMKLKFKGVSGVCFLK